MVATRYHAGADTGTEGQRGSVPVCRASLRRTQSWFLSRTMKYIKQESAAAKGRAGERRAGDASCWRPKRKADLTLQSLRFLQKDGKAPGHQRTRNRAR